MTDREQRLIEATMGYLDLFERGSPPHLESYLTGVEADLRDELRPLLEEALLADDLFNRIHLTVKEQTFAANTASRHQGQFEARWKQTTSETLTNRRKTLRLSAGKLAQSLNLPIGVVDRLERGTILLSTIPHQVVNRLASILNQTETEIQILLQNSQNSGRSRQTAYLSAQDGTTPKAEPETSFTEALQQSNPTPDQQQDWKA